MGFHFFEISNNCSFSFYFIKTYFCFDPATLNFLIDTSSLTFSRAPTLRKQFSTFSIENHYPNRYFHHFHSRHVATRHSRTRRNKGLYLRGKRLAIACVIAHTYVPRSLMCRDRSVHFPAEDVEERKTREQPFFLIHASLFLIDDCEKSQMREMG